MYFLEFQPEFCPKWKYLDEILSVEIPGDMKRRYGPDDIKSPKVLILCQDARTCYQLKQYLTEGGEKYLFYKALRLDVPIGQLSKSFEKIGNENKELLMTQAAKLTPSQLKEKLAKKSTKDGKDSENNSLSDSGILVGEVDELSQVLNSVESIEDEYLIEQYQESYMLTMTQTQFTDTTMKSIDSQEIAESIEYTQHDRSIFEPFPELENLDITAAVAHHKQPFICVQTFKTESEGPIALQNILEGMHPHYVILYNCNVMAVRQLEVYEARLCRPKDQRLKVFILTHGRTVEEQSYLTSLHREKRAFELIIETKRVS